MLRDSKSSFLVGFWLALVGVDTDFGMDCDDGWVEVLDGPGSLDPILQSNDS